MHSTVTAFVLAYDEPGWTQRTLESLAVQTYPLDVRMVERGGIWGMSDVFNAAAAGVLSDFYWFVTDVVFSPDTLDALVETMRANPLCAVVHPAHESDHVFLRAAYGPDTSVVPFTEWTAPLVRRKAWEQVGTLDEDMPYWGMDLDWSHRAKLEGWQCMVDRRVPLLEHTYLRLMKPRFAVTEERQQLRAQHDAQTEARLIAKWGANWKALLWPEG